MNPDQRYHTITKLLNEEIDDIVQSMLEEDELEYESERHKEMHRDELIENLLNLIKKDLQSDNA